MTVNCCVSVTMQFSDNPEERQQHLIERRKLALVLDLDETLISSRRINKQRILHGGRHQVQTSCGRQYTVRLRPGVTHFLDKMVQMYDMYVATYAERSYAKQVIKLLDPLEQYIEEDVFTREDYSGEPNKLSVLETLFPAENPLCIIVDDNAEMWPNVPQLIQAKPFKASSLFPKSDDRILYGLGKRLMRIHRRFYEAYDKIFSMLSPHLPDLVEIMKKPLLGLNIFLLHNLNDEDRCKISEKVECLGGRVQDYFVAEDDGERKQSTHIISSSSAHCEAVHYDLPVITDAYSWLQKCQQLSGVVKPDPYV